MTRRAENRCPTLIIDLNSDVRGHDPRYTRSKGLADMLVVRLWLEREIVDFLFRVLPFGHVRNSVLSVRIVQRRIVLLMDGPLPDSNGKQGN